MRLHDTEKVFDRIGIVEQGVVALYVPFNLLITVATRFVHHEEFIPMTCKVLTQKVDKTLRGDVAALIDFVGDASACHDRKYGCVLLEDFLGMRLDRGFPRERQ